MSQNVTTYYVLNGLVNGERGCVAHRSGGSHEPVQKDGHYYLIEGDADGVGPYDCREDALDAGLRWFTQVWLFPLDPMESPHRKVDGQDDVLLGDDANVATIRLMDVGGRVFSCEIEGSYETLTMAVSVRTHEQAAIVFAAAIRAQSDFI